MIGFEKATNQRRTTSQLYQLSIEVRTVFHIASILQIRCFNCLGVFPPGNSHRQLGPTSRTLYCLWTSLWKLMVSLISMPFPNTSQQHGMQRMGSWVLGKGGCFIGHVICGGKKLRRRFLVNIADLFSMSNKVEYCCQRGNKKVLSFLSSFFCWKVRYQ